MREVLVKKSAAPGKPFDHGEFEILTEPIPMGHEGEEPSIMNLPLTEVLALRHSEKGLWDADMRKSRLGKS